MTDDTLVNGLKAIFGTSAQGSAPASSALIPYMDASGNPVGLSSMSNLASVLGVTKREEFVDMGLPSGTLWASKNIGAETPEDYGYYFSWGNIEGHKPSGTTFSYNWGTSNDGPYASTIGAALTADIGNDNDASLRYFGGSCKMPTTAQFTEVVNTSYVTREFVTNYRGTGINGLLITSKTNGNKLFFPAAGYGSGTSLSTAGSNGYYWSRGLVSGGTDGYHLCFHSDGDVSPSLNCSRYFGFTVRAVQ